MNLLTKSSRQRLTASHPFHSRVIGLEPALGKKDFPSNGIGRRHLDLTAMVAHAGSATWDRNPTMGVDAYHRRCGHHEQFGDNTEFITAASKNGAFGEVGFTDSASVGNSEHSYRRRLVQFSNRSTASSATITNEDYGTTNFFGRSTSGGCLRRQNDNKFLITERS
jgi:hypothetical protein